MSGRNPRRVPMWLARGIAGASQLLHLSLPLNPDRLAFYIRKVVYLNDKAKTKLGWSPKVTLDEGMKQSEAWLREKGLL